MPPLIDYRLHHEGPIDPTLLSWIRSILDQFFGSGLIFVIILSLLILIVTFGIIFLGRRAKNQINENHSE
ncbi:MAG TPA: hypothetical protein EYQ00_06125 [Dehalococcoidia bacterium]|nr:hypothetical protein [Dehalococcoidia bacterium]